jgi:cyanophycinase
LPKHVLVSLLLVLVAAPVHAQAPTPPRGSLLIVGGGSQPDELVRHFIALAGGPQRARIAVVPMASTDPDAGKDKVTQLEEMGASAFLLRVTREQANAPNATDVLEGVTGVWFGGGDQELLAPVLLGTRLLAGIHELYEHGAVIGGTSAGAAIMPDTMITGNQIRNDSLAYYGDEFPVIARGTIHIANGFGFLPGTIIDQHFIARERHNRLLSAVLERPSLIGVGIDESTALEVMPNGRWKVRGASQAIVYDARSAEVSGAGVEPLGATGIRVHLLPAGATYDPATGTAQLP